MKFVKNSSFSFLSKRIVFTLLLLTIFMVMLPITAFADDILIEEANCTFTVPVEGAHPDLNPVSSDPERYTVELDCYIWMRVVILT